MTRPTVDLGSRSSPVPEVRLAGMTAEWSLESDLAMLPWSAATACELVRADGRGPLRWPTRVRIAWNAVALFVRFDCVDESRTAKLTARDAPLWEEEVVEMFLAPGAADPAVYFELEVNPLGALFDARVESPEGERATMRVDAAWHLDGLRWKVGDGSERRDWWAALALPWRGLGVEGGPPDRCCANFYRIEHAAAGEVEHGAWSPTFAAPADYHRPRCFGHLILERHAV